MNDRQRVFVDEYLKCWNASEAARRAGYKGKPNVIGARLLADVSISAMVKARLNELTMSADEVLIRLARHARGDLGEFIDTTTMSWDLAIQKAKENGFTDLIKKVKQRTTYTKDDEEIHQLEIELYDAQAALVQLGKYHGLFSDKVEHTGEITIEIEYVNDPIAPAATP